MPAANTYRLLILPGDGIGPEVMGEVRKVAEWFRDKRQAPIELSERPFGMPSWEKYGSLMPDETWAEIAAADAVLFGATGSLAQQATISVAERKKGSLLTMLVTLALSFPVGVLSAVYLEEYAPKNARWTEIIEVSINNLAAVPSIIFGLLGLAVFLNFMNLPRSAPLVGGLVLTLMTLPTRKVMA